MAKTDPPMRRRFGARWSSWCGPGVIRVICDPGALAREFEPSSQAIGNRVARADRPAGRREAKPAAAGLSAAEREALGRLRAASAGLACPRDRRDPVRSFGFMRANQADFPICGMARGLGVSKAGCPAGRPRSPAAPARADAAVLARSRTGPLSLRQSCGAPRVPAERRAAGERGGRKRIARLRRVAGLVGSRRRRGGPIPTQRAKPARPVPDLAARDCPAAGPNQLWLADITCVPTAAGFLSVAGVVAVCSRGVVGGAMANPLPAELVLDALNMAHGQRRPREVIPHSNRGSQDTSPAFAKRCTQAGYGP